MKLYYDVRTHESLILALAECQGGLGNNTITAILLFLSYNFQFRTGWRTSGGIGSDGEPELANDM